MVEEISQVRGCKIVQSFVGDEKDVGVDASSRR